MGDHFVLLVDRLLTESTLEAAISSRNQLVQATEGGVDESKTEKLESRDVSTPRKIVECRICQDEDDHSNMETPCSCCGSLEYAHRKCVQRWCNEKGNTMCEICHQQFKPGYTAPPPLFRLGRLPMNFRGNLETSARDSNGPRIVAMVTTDHSFLNPQYRDDYSTSTRNVLCCRTILVIFMFLLILRHTLPAILTRANDISFPLLMLLFLRCAGIILPIYVVVRAVTALHCHRFRQEPHNSTVATPDEEAPHTSNIPQFVYG